MSIKFYSREEYDIQKYSKALYNGRMKVDKNIKEFAKFLGINVSTYQRNERGLVDKIPVAIVDSFCKRFNTTSDALLFPANHDCGYITPKIKRWLSSKEAVPYILKAYNKFIEDEEAKLVQKAFEAGKTL